MSLVPALTEEVWTAGKFCGWRVFFKNVVSNRMAILIEYPTPMSMWAAKLDSMNYGQKVKME